MSARAPENSAPNIREAMLEVATRATMSARPVIWVMDQAAPTPPISRPKLASRLASQTRRNTASRKGAAKAAIGPAGSCLGSFNVSPSQPGTD